MSVIEDRLAAIATLELAKGGHESWEKGACVMEAVAYVAGEPWSDHPIIEAKFAPITAGLQTSALQLLDRMIDLSHEKPAGRPRPDFDPRIDYPERYTDGPV